MYRLSFEQREVSLKTLSIILVISLIAWYVGFYSWVSFARAGSLTSVSDTLSDSDLSANATHTISYFSTSSVSAGQTIQITFDPASSSFDGVGSVTNTHITVTGFNLTGTCSATSSEATLSVTTSPSEAIIFTVCAGDTISAGTKTITVGQGILTNPATAGSYVIRIAGTQPDNADTRVAIIDDIVMTASVDTSFTFVIQATTTGFINGETSTGLIASTTTTTIPFGTLAPNVPKAAGHMLFVTTNARNGFSVTLRQDGNLRSNTGADIDLFIGAAETAVPTAWTAPTGTIAAGENGYGHYGITSEDDLNGEEFGTSTALYAGNINAARQVFTHNGPSDGTTPNIGMTKVAVKIEISGLQEAATDYQNALTYVATPTF